MVCSKCGADGDQHFSPSALKEGSRNRWCRTCHRDYYRAQVAADKDYFLKYARRRLRRTKAILREERAKNGCAMCGEKHPACLEFHHKDESTKSFNIALGASRGKKGIDQLREELDKCTVLCSNCHRKHHYEQQSGMYNQPPIRETRKPIPY